MRALVCALVGLGMGAVLAASCSHETVVDGWSEPASEQERAAARRERDARKKALAEQGDRPEPEPEVAPPPPPPPPPPAPEVADAGTDAADAAVDAADAAVDAAPDAAPEAGAPDPGDLCRRICERALECARRMLEGAGDDPTFLERMLKEMGDQCREECAQRTATATTEQLAAAEKCLAVRDCEEFMTCMRELLGER
jgi:hypothetical protein